MPVYKPSELRDFLQSIGQKPKKGLSQNFLIDRNIINKIIAISEITPGDVILEIGPGPGSLTEALLEAGAHVVAVEKDTVLAEALKRLEGIGGQLEVFNEDILKFPIEDELGKRLKTGQKAKVIANLPYHLTTPILLTLVKMPATIDSLIVMVQEEVARRFTAMPSTKEYSSLTVCLRYYSNPQYGFTVSKHCFYPCPKVTSAIAKLDLRVPPSVSNEERFFLLTRTAFEHRRKMLRSSLREIYEPSQVMASLEALQMNPQARPEDLSLEQFISLFERLEGQ
jgi:16S rRNA (adenine1518-N6/adenine1519-N6)-dimethyltransferase